MKSNLQQIALFAFIGLTAFHSQAQIREQILKQKHEPVTVSRHPPRATTPTVPTPRNISVAPPASRGDIVDARHGHNHAYAAHGSRLHHAPPAHHIHHHGGSRWHFNFGVWYGYQGGYWVASPPPFGITVQLLPHFYTTLWFGGSPYYYANNVYYQPNYGGYVVVQPPTQLVYTQTVASSAAPAIAPVAYPSAPIAPYDGGINYGTNGGGSHQATANTTTPSSGLFVYPRNAQSVDQMTRDRSECQSWAGSQTSSALPQEFQRAISACLEGRGYTVR